METNSVSGGKLLFFLVSLLSVQLIQCTVTYDRKAIIINGKKRLLISGSIHYPRSTPEMWGDLIQKAKDGGLDVIQKIVQMMNNERLFQSQGGPIILSQIENEYGPFSHAFGAAGHAYMTWAANMAVGVRTGVPWVMCKEDDAPDSVVSNIVLFCLLPLPSFL